MRYESEKMSESAKRATPHFLPVCFEVDKSSAQIILESVFGSCLKVDRCSLTRSEVLYKPKSKCEEQNEKQSFYAVSLSVLNKCNY